MEKFSHFAEVLIHQDSVPVHEVEKKELPKLLLGSNAVEAKRRESAVDSIFGPDSIFGQFAELAGKTLPDILNLPINISPELTLTGIKPLDGAVMNLSGCKKVVLLLSTADSDAKIQLSGVEIKMESSEKYRVSGTLCTPDPLPFEFYFDEGGNPILPPIDSQRIATTMLSLPDVCVSDPNIIKVANCLIEPHLNRIGEDFFRNIGSISKSGNRFSICSSSGFETQLEDSPAWLVGSSKIWFSVAQTGKITKVSCIEGLELSVKLDFAGTIHIPVKAVQTTPDQEGGQSILLTIRNPFTWDGTMSVPLSISETGEFACPPLKQILSITFDSVEDYYMGKIFGPWLGRKITDANRWIFAKAHEGFSWCKDKLEQGWAGACEEVGRAKDKVCEIADLCVEKVQETCSSVSNGVSRAAGAAWDWVCG